MAELSLRLSKIDPKSLNGNGGKAKMETTGARVYTIDHDGHARGIEIVTPKRIYALPWSHYFRAEGNNSEIVARFSTDDVTIKGSRLAVLLKEFAQQRLTAIRQLPRVERMELSKEGPDIDEITVEPASDRES